MARKPRLHLPGGLYHVMLRGNDGQCIFFGDEDYAHFSALAEEGIGRFGHRIHAFCWMPNHVHLAVQVAETPLSKIMQNVAFRYARWINRRRGRVGHLFQGRYKAILVDADSYLLELVRYIHLNPVRSGLVPDPSQYSWSGHRAYLGQSSIPWLTTTWVLSQFHPQTEKARVVYNRFIMDGIGEPRREEFHTGVQAGPLLGDDQFIRRVLGRQERNPVVTMGLDELVRLVCKTTGTEPSELLVRSRHAAQARAWIALLAIETGIASLTDVSHRFNRDIATLSNAVRRLRARIQEDDRAAGRWAVLWKKVKENSKA